jgi:hypothetical protein
MAHTRTRRLTAAQRRNVLAVTRDRCGGDHRSGVPSAQWQRALSYTAFEMYKAGY